MGDTLRRHNRFMQPLYIGLMSGTSLDGVDGALVGFTPSGRMSLKVLAHSHRPFEAALAKELLALNGSGKDELHRAALAANGLVRVYAGVVDDLLHQADVPATRVKAIGAHGQTVRHRPHEFDATGYTVQLNNPALLAELTGIDVVADFRSRDVAAGGQGAPLVPAFHRAAFGRPHETVAVLNLGGIGNVTVLLAEGMTLGFDCGPGNALMDHWCQRHLGLPFDEDGAWAASGAVIERLMQGLQAEPYFAKPPPKSTGRDLFNSSWLEMQLHAMPSVGALRPEDVQATLAELTAWSACGAIVTSAPWVRSVLVCGGGARNAYLMERLAARLSGVQVATTDSVGLAATQVEAAAFAWLAKAFVDRQPGNLTAVTGAAGPRVLGALYPAG
jgi:anhydro-N-acetylmuramic acid kinase